jgi:ribonuclease HI
MQSKITFYIKPSSLQKIITPKIVPKLTPKIVPMQFEYELFFDGCSKGNPGPAGAGAVIYKNDVEIWSNSIFVGKKETNNVAEYSGLILGLEEAVKQNIKELSVKGDSELVIKQINGLYKVKSPSMIPLYIRVKSLQNCFDRIEFVHLYRDKNRRADELSNMGLSKK